MVDDVAYSSTTESHEDTALEYIMIKPTIFIGLGTTGTNILKTFRQLIFEEYGHAGLPIFRYIAIETTEHETGDNPPQFEEYERISVVNATIASLAPIQMRLDPNHPYYNPHLAEWLNPDLLNQTQSFTDGAANIRMAGRLCLWENWVAICRSLSSARNAIISADSVPGTQQILRQHYEAKNLGVPYQLVDNNGVDVYIFGSLCGGTCSGMLIDIAYLLRNLLSQYNGNEVTGIFTMYDRFSAEGWDLTDAIRAANCYSSLSELNYYNHPNTIYEVIFPNDLRVNTPQKPYDYELIVSPTGKNPNTRFVSSDGRIDEDGLNLMVALNLFAESAADTDGHKKAIRTDWVGFEGFGALKLVSRGEIPTMTRGLASFGLTAVWYPKYRIATAAACRISRELCQNWLSASTSGSTILRDTEQAWDTIRQSADILASPEGIGQPSLRDEIETELNKACQVFNQEASVNTLRYWLNKLPGGVADPVTDRFDISGRYYAWMKAKVGECQKAFSEAIDNTLKDQLAKIDFQGEYGLADVRAFFEELDQIIEQALLRCPERLPILDLNALDFEPMHRAEKNIWLKITGRKKRVVEIHREKLIEDYRQLIIGHEGIYPKMRNYFLRPVLEAARAKLGFGVHSDGLTIKQQLDQITVNLEHCEQELQEEYKYVIRPPKYGCVKIVTNNLQNSIETDAESLSAQIVDDAPHPTLFVEDGHPITMDTFFNKEHEEMKLWMIETYRDLALRRINQTAEALATTKTQELLNVTDNDIEDLARRSNPYQEFVPEYQPFVLEPRTKIIVGHDPTNYRLNNLQMNLGFDRTSNSSVDRFLFFYEEEAGFAPNDLAVYELLKHHFESSPGAYGHSTHQDSNFYDLSSNQ